MWQRLISDVTNQGSSYSNDEGRGLGRALCLTLYYVEFTKVDQICILPTPSLQVFKIKAKFTACKTDKPIAQ